jgi:transaldolase
MTRLSRLAELGTSVWLDGLVAPDELRRLVARDAVTGPTSNPTIFRAAVLGSERYRATLDARTPIERYEAIAVADVQAAADVLRPVFAATGGRDGFVSLEVAPELADDVAGTVHAARRLWRTVDRPNAIIKIPGTPAGIEAVREAIAAGMNVNVTLLFARAAHRAAMEAYLAGLEDRVGQGLPVEQVSSVASFFVSRIDSAIDPLVRRSGRHDLTGTAAVANARLAYAQAHDVFSSARFAALEHAGARPQRVLWASTGTKDPRYSDVKYVDELAGPGVVNTMPPGTLAAFRDHGCPADALTGTAAAASAALRELAAAGVDLDAVTARLLADGVAGFAASMRDLLAGIAAPVLHA